MAVPKTMHPDRKKLHTVKLVYWLPRDYWYCGGVLFIREDLPVTEIICTVFAYLTGPPAG